MNNIWNWIVVSSADPSKTSLTVKAAGVLAIPYVLNSVKIACGVGLVCIGVDSASLNGLVDASAGIVEAALSLIGGIAFVYGFARKVALSISR